MALAEDAASVLDSFVHDAANLPAEIAHLLEEIQAKDKQVEDCKNNILIRDSSLQKHVKAQGGHVKHPKEDQMVKTVLSNYEAAQTLQDDKVTLSEKARLLLDRHVKRLDIKIRDLQSDGSIPDDHQLPSLLHQCAANLVDPDSSTSTGANTPLNAVSFHSGTTNIANAAMARMANNAAQSNRIFPSAPVAGMQPHPLLGPSGLAHKQREMSAGASDPKRRRLNATLGTLPNPSSGLARAASMGPGTPKAGTPGSRAGSAGPRIKKPAKKLAPHQQNMRKQITKNGLSKKSVRRLMGGNRASPSTTGDDNSEGSGSDDNVAASVGHDGADDEDMEDAGYDDEGEDNKLYCFCRSVSHGDMVACDNAKCEFEWFHWECVGLTSEPKGRWLCSTCKKLPQNQIKLAAK